MPLSQGDLVRVLSPNFDLPNHESNKLVGHILEVKLVMEDFEPYPYIYFLSNKDGTGWFADENLELVYET